MGPERALVSLVFAFVLFALIVVLCPAATLEVCCLSRMEKCDVYSKSLTRFRDQEDCLLALMSGQKMAEPKKACLSPVCVNFLLFLFF